MNMRSQRVLMDRITEEDGFNAAETILSCVLADNELLKECTLEPEDFEEELHQIVFREASRLIHAGHGASAIALKPSVPKELVGVKFTPAQYLVNLAVNGTNPDTKARFDVSVETVKAVSLARAMVKEGAYLSDLGSEGHNALTLLEEYELLEARFKERLARLHGLKSTTSAGSAYMQSFNASARADGVIGVPIALPEIAKVLSEPVFEAGNLYGLLSSSGEGKSSLTMQLIYHAVRQGHPVLFLSYDQSASQCVRQMISQVHGISVAQQNAPFEKMTDAEREKCIKFATWIDRQPLEIIRCQREGVTQLLAYARRFVKQHANGKAPFIVIDHIGKVRPRDPKLSPDRISGEVTVELKAFAEEAHAAVMILNQRNTAGTVRDNPRPISRDLYGGEGAKADYDGIIYLYRPAKYKADREATAARDSDWKTINKVFGHYGEEIDSIAEIGAIKVRFGDSGIREILKFIPRFTRYESKQAQQNGRLL